MITRIDRWYMQDEICETRYAKRELWDERVAIGLNAESSWCEMAQKNTKPKVGKKVRRILRVAIHLCGENELKQTFLPRISVDCLGRDTVAGRTARNWTTCSIHFCPLLQYGNLKFNAQVVECLLPAGARGCRLSVLSTSRSMHHCNGEIIARILPMLIWKRGVCFWTSRVVELTHYMSLSPCLNKP